MAYEFITTERHGRVLLIGLNRPAKLNAFTTSMLGERGLAYGDLERDPEVWVGVLFAHGDHFTAGLDLAEVAPKLGSGLPQPDGSIDPWGINGPARTKPMVAAIHGRCLTLGIELALAADVRVAATDTRFAQLEVQRGIYPFGGATIRFPREAGWGNAMRWILTGDEFGAEEAYRIGVVQEVVASGTQLDRAMELAERIAAQAPLAVRATLASARRAVTDGERAAAEALLPELLALFGTADVAEGVASFVERRAAVFQGR